MLQADQVSLKKIEELCQSEITNASSIDLNDESDGVSVLSESESDDLARDNHKQVDDKIALCRRRVDIDTIKKAELQTTCNDESSVSSLKVFFLNERARDLERYIIIIMQLNDPMIRFSMLLPPVCWLFPSD